MSSIGYKQIAYNEMFVCKYRPSVLARVRLPNKKLKDKMKSDNDVPCMFT